MKNYSQFHKNVANGDYSLDAAFKKLHIPVAAICYLEFDPEYPAEDMEKLKNDIFHSAIAYCSGLPHDANQFTVNSMIAPFIEGMSTCFDSLQFIDVVLSLTTFRHMPTYVHSLMVSWLTELICTYFCSNNPSYLIGIEHTCTVDEVCERSTEIIEYARIAGLCHDVGKSTYINTIAKYGRKLSNHEFAIIQMHPEKGYELLKNSNFNGVADIALGHHKWYDGTKGYPASFDHRTSMYRPLIDIVSVCDSIDAATDTLGRTYTNGRTLYEVISEIQAQAGTRYSPDVAAALSDPSLAAQIGETIHSKKLEAYSTAFKNIYPQAE